jgi:hypothetical protein
VIIAVGQSGTEHPSFVKMEEEFNIGNTQQLLTDHFQLTGDEEFKPLKS